MFLPRGVSDHSPSLLSFKGGVRKRRWGFKFDNYLVHHKHFLPIVSDVWQKRIEGTFMFQVTQKLKALKKPLRSLRNTYGDLNLRAVKLKTELDVIQIAADMDPFNLALREDLEFLRVAYQQARHDEEVAIMQRAKVKWLKDGDANTKYFHMVVKEKRNAQQIHSVRKVDGMFVYDDDVLGAFVDNLKALLGTRDDSINPDMPDQFFVNTLSLAESLDMIRPISDADIRHAIFSIGNDKAPGSDGFSATFFKAAWNVIGPEVMRAIHNFFYRSRLDKEINHTLLCLLPKSPNASSVTDFRPISCCTVLYKCISKILVDRIKPYLDGLVSRSQSAFISGRRIVDNILMAHELVVGYHLQVGQPRCAFKIDIRKAYDMVDWRFLFNMLSGVDGSRLSLYISYRAIHSAGFLSSWTVADLYASMHGVCPTDWLSRFPHLAGNAFPTLTDDLPDSLCWNNDDSGVFLVRNAYNSIIGNFDEIPWWRTVWFKGHIPKHAFCLWTACVRRLPTQDRISIWKHEPPNLVCPLCGDGPDSHTHLFFTCVFAKEVWSAIRVRMEWEDFPDAWDDIMVAISDPVTSPKGLVRKLSLAASVYAIWRERNKRLFRGDKKSTHAIISEISEVVRLRVAWKMSKDKQHDDVDAA
ncbi:hypothetical protein OSB04_un000106 [Centaurea solstitialis]|uniref:Reverse transcriptase domain-containing protein n=1 Tax=Centaurea solstitialis TaxID=347529 RepID=A0AA38W681_9ASTR|nr:hypothetical protein OSB04_un000106 [Centaurea solstitialis]